MLGQMHWYEQNIQVLCYGLYTCEDFLQDTGLIHWKIPISNKIKIPELCLMQKHEFIDFRKWKF